MRLPFLQVTQETWEYARQLEVLTGAPMASCFMALCDVWRWALSLGPDDQPPTGICDSPRAEKLLCAAAGWAGDAAVLVGSLEDLDLVERLPVGLRVKGIRGRYEQAWLNAKTRSAKARKAAEKRWGCSTDAPAMLGACSVDAPRMPRDAKTQTQTNTQTHTKEEKETTTLSAAPTLPLLVAVEPKEELEDLRKAWNQHAHPSMPRWDEWNDDRRRKAKARLKERTISQWVGVIQRMNASPFLTGQVNHFRATPDWFLKPANITKVLEGNYSGQGPPAKGRATNADKDWSQPVKKTANGEIDWNG